MESLNYQTRVENAKKLVNEWKKEVVWKNFKVDLYMCPSDFIDSLNDRAISGKLNEPMDDWCETLYRHYTLYNGVVIFSDTESKIYDL